MNRTGILTYLNLGRMLLRCGGTKDVLCFQGDSGGPLMMPCITDTRVNYYQMGIVSFGPSCTSQDRFGVYTNVSSFMSWIVDHLD